MSSKETIHKAYGNIPKEPNIQVDLSWVPTFRGIKFYWIKLVRYITR